MQLILALLLLLFSSCSGPGWVRASLEAYANPQLEVETIHSFQYEANRESSHPLRDQAIYSEVRSLLQSKGLTETKDSDMLVQVETSSKESSIQVPAHYEMGHYLYPGYFGYAYSLGADGNQHPLLIYYPGTWQSTPYRVPARSIPAYSHQLDLRFSTADGTLLWQGTLKILDRSADLMGLIQLFLKELIEEFPQPQHNGSFQLKAPRASQSAATVKPS